VVVSTARAVWTEWNGWDRISTSKQLVVTRLDLVVAVPTHDRLIDGEPACRRDTAM
jgi:hypothetical protein